MVADNTSAENVLVVIPTYNEAENLTWLLPEILEIDRRIDILVVDDYLDDRTKILIDRLSEKFPNKLTLITRMQNQSYAKSLLEGLRYGKVSNYSKVIQMDADGSHDPKDITRFIESQANLTIGSRYVSDSIISNVPFIRRFYSLAGNLVISLLWRSTIKDKTNGYRAYDSSALEVILNQEYKSVGFSIQFEILKSLLDTISKLKVEEISVHFKYRELGNSKFDFVKLYEALIFAFRLRKKNV